MAGESLDRVDAVVVGAGVVGLATARALAMAGHEVVILEAGPRYGEGVSSRHSEVIHAGLYYPVDSLKARLCVRGKALMVAYCTERGVPHRVCGKLVVATAPEQAGTLEKLRAHAAALQVPLHPLTRAEAQAMEPALACTEALWSPSSGIVDSHALMTALLADAESHGAVLALNSPFVRAEAQGDGAAQGWYVEAAGVALQSRIVVNAAGLQAQAVARALHGLSADHVPARRLAKGHYFALSGRSPFSRLIYPTPVDGGLGVHLTLDLAGAARFGPDVQWLPDRDVADSTFDYSVGTERQAAFEADIRRYWPGLPEGALHPAYSGIRPKLSGPGEPAADFRIDGPATHGMAGLVNLFGIESPGLTSSLALAEEVLAALEAGE
jgi:L-2-hydroxyglutarate oxidase LhgO